MSFWKQSKLEKNGKNEKDMCKLEILYRILCTFNSLAVGLSSEVYIPGDLEIPNCCLRCESSVPKCDCKTCLRCSI